MAVMYVMDFDDTTKGQYDAMLAELDVDDQKVDGGIVHVAGPTETGWRIVDVWESPEHFKVFRQYRLGPTREKLGIPAPRVQVTPVHSIIFG